MKLTINQLRSILFSVENQDMTIAELRKSLFNINGIDDDEFESVEDISKIFIDKIK